MMKFKRHIGFVALGFVLAMGMLQPAQASFPTKYHPGFYLRFDFSPARINSTSEFQTIQNIPQFQGVQIRYAWKYLETSRGVYNFSAIEKHLNYLKNMPTPKRLIIEILDHGPNRTTTNEVRVPAYLRTAEFEGGVYKSARGNVSAKRWNTNVQTRQIALLKALGARFNKEPYLEGVILGETATSISQYEFGRANYTPDKYYNGIKRIMSGMKAAFPNTMGIQWINWFDGNNRDDSISKIAGLAQHAFQLGLGFGGPETDPSKTLFTYPYYGKYAGSMPLVNSVEWDDWNSGYTSAQILNFARRTMHTTHLAWMKKEPYWTNQVVPLVRSAGRP